MYQVLHVNTTVGEYRIIGFLGAGGMGEVYRAEHKKIGRSAAVKVLTHTSNTDGSLERFFNEAQIQASLRHPNVATLYDFTEVGGQPCIIMEYVDGQTLAERIRPCGPMSLAETVYIFQAVVEAIAYIHDNGVVHRDIKSNNIKVSSNGEVKLLDFGIAKSEASQQLTATGSVIGTLEYLSPEQLMGGFADARSDIWALGVLLYEMAVGRVPFEAITIGELCRKIQKVEYTPASVLNPAVPREVATIITRCLRKNPMDRYRTARDLLEETKRLRALVSTPGLSGVAETGFSRRGPLKVSLAGIDKKIAGAVAAALVTIVLLGFGFYLLTTHDWSAATSAQSAPTETVEPTSSTSAAQPANVLDTVTVTIDAIGGTAKVYQDGKFVNETPCPITAHIGETVNVELRRDGFDPYRDSFTVTAQTRTKSFQLKASEPAESP
ncbi:MAG TPA: serine/threonine-protein kinase [Pyrinomonadaceae bacterium]|jgi:serine/threonine-protein kinase